MMRNQSKAWSIGRENVDQADILLPNDTVSKNHATLNLHNGQYYLIDNGSTNGTYLAPNLAKIVDTHTPINPNDIIHFGEFKCMGKDLIYASEHANFTNTDCLITVSGKSNQIQPTPKPIDSKPGTRTRCRDCLATTFTNQPCENCGSKKHMGDNI